MYQRTIIKEIEKRITSDRKFIQVIAGPRQVGKTTIVNQLLKKIKIPSYYISADIIYGSDVSWIEKQWEVARQQYRQSKAKEFILAIDEIQKIEYWSTIIKKLWDEDTLAERRIKVIISGSSRLLLQKGLTESLAGRFEMTYMGHWSYNEMAEAFGWTPEQFVWFGGYPGSADLIDDESRWKRYISDSLIETSISKDVLMLTRVDKPALLRRLFELGCNFSGQILSYTKMLGQLQDAGNTVTLAHYLNLLGTAGLLSGIEKYSGSKVKQRSSSPKFLVHNTALISSKQQENFEQIRPKPDLWGRFVESAVGAHLINFSVTGGFSLFYWRQGNYEVDFILEKRGKVIALEIKSGTSSKAAGMEKFKQIFSPYKLLLIGEKGLPWQDFLKIDPEELF